MRILKKLFALAMACAVLAVFAACGTNKNNASNGKTQSAVSVSADATQETSDGSQAAEPSGESSSLQTTDAPEVEYGKIYEASKEKTVRLHVRYEEADVPQMLFLTRESVEEYISGGDWERYFVIDDAAGKQLYAAAFDAFDDEFFRENFLTVTFAVESSGSNTVSLAGGSLEQDGVFKVHLTRYHPYYGTADMAFWFVFAGFPKTLAPENGRIEVVSEILEEEYSDND